MFDSVCCNLKMKNYRHIGKAVGHADGKPCWHAIQQTGDGRGRAQCCCGRRRVAVRWHLVQRRRGCKGPSMHTSQALKLPTRTCRCNLNLNTMSSLTYCGPLRPPPFASWAQPFVVMTQVIVWSLTTSPPTKVGEFYAHFGTVFALAATPWNVNWVLSAGGDTVVKIWDVTTTNSVPMKPIVVFGVASNTDASILHCRSAQRSCCYWRL